MLRMFVVLWVIRLTQLSDWLTVQSLVCRWDPSLKASQSLRRRLRCSQLVSITQTISYAVIGSKLIAISVQTFINIVRFGDCFAFALVLTRFEWSEVKWTPKQGITTVNTTCDHSSTVDRRQPMLWFNSIAVSFVHWFQKFLLLIF